MPEIKLDADTLRLVALFEKITRARVKDIIEDEDRKTFVVEEGQVGKAVGRGAQNLKRLREILEMDVEIIGYAADRVQFVKNVFHRFQIKEVNVEESSERGAVARVKVDPKDKGKVIGKGGRNVSLARMLAKRHHELEDVIIE